MLLAHNMTGFSNISEALKDMWAKDSVQLHTSKNIFKY